MSSPEFGIPALESLALISQVVGVITQPDRPSGRGKHLVPPPIKNFALHLGLPVIQPKRLRDPETMAQLTEWEPDLIVVAAYGQILKPALLGLPALGCINLHASLLPRHRGAAPIQAAILAGDETTGISLMQMDQGLDTGPILAQESIPILPEDTAKTLAEKLSVLAADTLRKHLPVYIQGGLSPKPQDDTQATYAPQLRKEDGKLDFHLPAIVLERKVRAYFPWPGAYTLLDGQILKIHTAGVEQGKSLAPVGSISIHAHFPAIQTGQGWLILRDVQPAGRRAMTGDVFLRGAHDLQGKVLS